MPDELNCGSSLPSLISKNSSDDKSKTDVPNRISSNPNILIKSKPKQPPFYCSNPRILRQERFEKKIQLINAISNAIVAVTVKKAAPDNKEINEIMTLYILLNDPSYQEILDEEIFNALIKEFDDPELITPFLTNPSILAPRVQSPKTKKPGSTRNSSPNLDFPRTTVGMSLHKTILLNYQQVKRANKGIKADEEVEIEEDVSHFLLLSNIPAAFTPSIITPSTTPVSTKKELLTNDLQSTGPHFPKLSFPKEISLKKGEATVTEDSSSTHAFLCKEEIKDTEQNDKFEPQSSVNAQTINTTTKITHPAAPDFTGCSIYLMIKNRNWSNLPRILDYFSKSGYRVQLIELLGQALEKIYHTEPEEKEHLKTYRTEKKFLEDYHTHLLRQQCVPRIKLYSVKTLLLASDLSLENSNLIKYMFFALVNEQHRNSDLARKKVADHSSKRKKNIDLISSIKDNQESLPEQSMLTDLSLKQSILEEFNNTNETMIYEFLKACEGLDSTIAVKLKEYYSQKLAPNKTKQFHKAVVKSVSGPLFPTNSENQNKRASKISIQVNTSLMEELGSLVPRHQKLIEELAEKEKNPRLKALDEKYEILKNLKERLQIVQKVTKQYEVEGTYFKKMLSEVIVSFSEKCRYKFNDFFLFRIILDFFDVLNLDEVIQKKQHRKELKNINRTLKTTIDIDYVNYFRPIQQSISETLQIPKTDISLDDEDVVTTLSDLDKAMLAVQNEKDKLINEIHVLKDKQEVTKKRISIIVNPQRPNSEKIYENYAALFRRSSVVTRPNDENSKYEFQRISSDPQLGPDAKILGL